MKLKAVVKKVHYTLPMMLLALSCTEGNAGTMGPEVLPCGKAYVGIFGGGGASEHSSVRQYGTAFFTEADGGPLAVNAFGTTNSRSVGLIGGHVGYKWADASSNLLNTFNLFTSWVVAPAIELEGYYLTKSSFHTHDIANDTVRLDEHDFLVQYPTTAGVFLTNAILNINTEQSRFHPYLGGGIGAALISINHASAYQVAPPEVGVNHYNAHTSDRDATFAAQGKVGLSFDINENLSVFGEYRGLYVANSNYTFGSTVYPGHAATSPWSVELGSQFYNMGALGLHYTV